MPSQKSSSSSASSTYSIPPQQLVALPSLASSLCSLPQAKSIDSLSLHPSMLAQRNAESQAKLQKALSKSSTSTNLASAYAAPLPPTQYSSSNNSPPLMMRKPAKSKIQV
ncbi:uncharacterized protein BXZ73DRAFT_80337 [Epithele typhae]|uniref:uncharacterized protein n=1 Tax=Epithele typhae TaxID=378194 RepID=UPI002008394A|nr:uncharacterized protein BXZ73DRAFT_80337 [Epithele typhae]KAH9919465.1 hypothetical protein BXZ73DRAFT_80337 [Epithele typhae]